MAFNGKSDTVPHGPAVLMTHRTGSGDQFAGLGVLVPLFPLRDPAEMCLGLLRLCDLCAHIVAKQIYDGFLLCVQAKEQTLGPLDLAVTPISDVERAVVACLACIAFDRFAKSCEGCLRCEHRWVEAPDRAVLIGFFSSTADGYVR